MRTQLLKLVVILLVAGSGVARPQRSGADSATQPETTITSDAQWGAHRFSNKSHDIVRNDSRYTGTTGNNRKSYITYFRDSVNPLREHNAVGSRMSSSAPSEMVRSYNTRRSKIDDIWAMPEYKAAYDPPDISRTGISSKLSEIDTVPNSNKPNNPAIRVFSSNFRQSHDEKVGRVTSALSPNKNITLTTAEVNYSRKVNDNLERLKADVTLNRDFKSTIVQTKHSFAENDSSMNRSFVRTNITGLTIRNNISMAEKNRQMLGLIRPNLFPDKSTVRDNVSYWKPQQSSNVSSLQLTSAKIHSNHQGNLVNYSIRENVKPVRKITNRIVPNMTRYGDLKSEVVVDPFRHLDGIQRDVLNNSGKPARRTETTHPIQNPKSEAVGQSRSAFHRNFVKLLYSPSATNYYNQTVKYVASFPGHRANADDVALNPRNETKLKKNDDVRFTSAQTRGPNKSHLAQTAARKPDLTDHARLKPTLLPKNRYSSHAQKLPSQGESVGNRNKTSDGYGNRPLHNAYLKNWPNGALQNIEDLYNYEKYTSSLEQSDQDSSFQDADRIIPVLSSNDEYINHPDSVLDTSVKKIIQWLKIPPIVPNRTYIIDNDHEFHKPVESVLESIYGNLEPNRPLSVNTQTSPYTNVLQDVNHNQSFDRIDYHQIYPNRWPNSSSIIRPAYITDSSNTLTPSVWPNTPPLRNHTVYHPVTHVTQDTVVHILNNDVKKPNVTVTHLKIPQSDVKPAMPDQASSGSSSESSSAQRPNVHIMFTSEKDKDKEPSKQETNTFPSSSYNTNCPTIMINSYTRVNNTLQSKEDCTDLNIIINSHISNTNVFKPSSGPTEDQPISLGTQSYEDTDGNNKYTENIDDLSHQDSLQSYVTASTAGTYSSDPYETLQPTDDNYYDSQKDPTEILNQGDLVPPELSTVEVFQGTQISVSGSNVPLADAETTAGPLPGGADGPAGSSVDGPGLGNDVSSSVDGSPASMNVPPVGEGLPSSSHDSGGTVMGQANNALMPGSLQLPALPSLPSRPNIPLSSGLSSVTNGLSSLHGSSSSLSHADDDDDDFDLSPGTVLHSIASVFTYFTFLNPLGYTFFSLAAAPFAAMAAGVLGVAAFIFPWAFSNVFDFGRATDKVTIAFRPNLEEFVRQAMPYDRVNEWKSRRRKRRK